MKKKKLTLDVDDGKSGSITGRIPEKVPETRRPGKVE